MSADYSELPPADAGAVDAGEYTVTIDDVEFPTWQIDAVQVDDGEGVFFVVEPAAVETFHPIALSEPVEVETPAETFTGTVEMVALEHGALSIRVDRRDCVEEGR